MDRLLSTFRRLAGELRGPDNLAVRVRIDQLDTRARFSAVAAGMGMVVAALLAREFWSVPGPAPFRPTILCLLACYALSFVLFRRWLRLPDKAVGLRREHALLCAHQAALGLSWAISYCEMMTMADVAHRSVLYGVAVGLMSATAFTGPVGIALTFWAPVTVGVLASMLLLEGPVHLYVLLCLIAYAVVTGFAIVFLNIRLTRQAIAAIRIEESNEVIRILLRDFEESSSDWLWETDAGLTLSQVSPRFAEVAGRPAGQLGIPFLRLLGAEGEAGRAGEHAQALLQALAQRQSFRDCVVPVLVRGERRYWSLSGKPVFGARGTFAGYRGVGSDITAAQLARERVAYLARYDSLTRLTNRVVFNETLEHCFAAAAAGGAPDAASALLYLDLDDFKAVNDTHGHAIGDGLLAAFADRLRCLLRDEDTAARLGGDEFAILMPGADAAAAHALARRLADVALRPFVFDSAMVETGLSIGIALAPADGTTPEQLCKAADLALYSAKSAGGGTAHFYDPATDHQLQMRRSLHADLKRAIGRGDLTLAFQPIVELGGRRTAAVEALVRWTHPERGPQPPSAFIPMAERSGLIVPLGTWVLKEACRVAALLPPSVDVAINLSPIQLREEGLVALVSASLAAHGLAPGRLEFEVTETAALETTGRTMENLVRLRDLGCRIALDDFGTGFSSLASMRGFPFDKLKIDRSFIDDLGVDDRTGALFEMIMALGRRMNITIVAEGIETAEQAEIVRLYGCDQAQGFFFAKPMEECALLAHMTGLRETAAIRC